MAITDRRGNPVDAAPVVGTPDPGLAIKAPCVAATTTNSVLSGLLLIDGVQLAAGNRVLVWMQGDPSTNGIYNASAGSWTRAIDANRSELWAHGTVVMIHSGARYAGALFECTSPDPIALTTSPLTFAIAAAQTDGGVSVLGNIAVFSNTSSSKVTASPVAQPGNPGRAAIVAAIGTPPVDGTIHNFAQFSVGSPITEVNQWGGDTYPVHHGVVGTINIPAGSTVVQGAALAGYAVSFSAANSPLGTPPASIGVYGQATLAVAGGNAFASNFTAANIYNFGTKAAPDLRAFNGNFFCPIEADVSLYQTAPGVDPVVAGDNATAFYASGGGNFTGTIGTGFVVGPASGNGGKRTWGFRTEDGVAVGGMLIGATGTGNNVGSQPLSFRGRDSGGTARLASIAADASGTLVVTSAAATNFKIGTAFRAFNSGAVAIGAGFDNGAPGQLSVVGVNCSIGLQGTTDGVSNAAVIQVLNSTATIDLAMIAHEPSKTGARWGQAAIGNWAEIANFGAGSNGLAIGTIDPKPFILGTGSLPWMTFGGAGGITVNNTSFLATGVAAAVGYSAGAGGAVTQTTSRTTAVTLNKISGSITLVSAAGTSTIQALTVNNSTVAATDVIITNQKSGTDKYTLRVTNVAAGSFEISYSTTGGTTTEQPVFSFAVLKAANS